MAKRTNERQLTKDDDPDEDETETSGQAGTFQRASASTLKARRQITIRYVTYSLKRSLVLFRNLNS